jgi:uncharacterized protein YbgA (DUF1722 family)/uncharacterized protein YbbK (DUF523 family)
LIADARARPASRVGPDDLPPRPEPPLDVAVSQCLLGEPVRYDGGHKRSSLPHALLDELFALRGVCPEVGIGLGVPRDPIRLIGSPAAPRALGVVDPNLDVTERLHAFARQADALLDRVCGLILMTGSPSCGLFDVEVRPDASSPPVRSGRGIFAAAVVAARPDLPVEDCGRLFETARFESFVTRVFAYAHWRAVCTVGVNARRLIAFHSRYKYLLMAHSVPHYREAGRLLANVSAEVPTIAARYVSILMAGIACPASRASHANVLAHLQGYLKRALDAAARANLAAAIEAYRRGEIELDAPRALLASFLERHADPYLAEQIYLKALPAAAGTRRQS